MLSSAINIEDQINLNLIDQCKINDEIIFIGLPKNFKNLKPIFISEKPIKIFSYKNYDLDELLLNIKVENQEKVEVFEDLIGLRDEDKYYYKYNDERKNGIFNLLDNNEKNKNLKLISKEQKKIFSLSTIFKKYNLGKNKILLFIFDENLIDKKLLENIDIEFIKTIIYWSNEKYFGDDNYFVNEFPNNNIKICSLDEYKIYTNKLNTLRTDIKNKNSRYLELKNLNEELVSKIDSKDSEFLELHSKYLESYSQIQELNNLNKELVAKIDSKDSEFLELKNLNKNLVGKVDSKDSEFLELKNLNKELVAKIDSTSSQNIELQNENKKLNSKYEDLTKMNHLNFLSLKTVFPYKRFIELYKGFDIDPKDKENILKLFKLNLNEYQNYLTNESINNYHLKLYSYSLFKLLSFSNKELSNIFTKQVNKNELGSKRKFVKVIGTEKNLGLNKEHKFAKRFTLYNFSNSSLCTFIPKNACTSLRFSFALSNGFIRGFNDIDWIHGNNDSQTVSEKELINCSYSFVILRSPFTRLSSYFLDKIVGNIQNLSSNDESYNETIFDSNFDVKDLTFEKFVNIIWENPKIIYKDIHTTPQIEFLLFNQYDKWAALEDLSKEIHDIELNSGIKFFDTRKFVNNTTYKCEINDIEYFGDMNVKSLRDLKSKKILPSHQMLYNNESAYKCLNLYISDVFLYIEKTKSFKELKSFFDLSQEFLEKNC